MVLNLGNNKTLLSVIADPGESMRHFLENIYFDKKLDVKDILDLYPKTIIDLRPNEFKFVIEAR